MEDKKSTEKPRQQYDNPIAQIMREVPEVFTDLLGLNAEGAFFKQHNLKQVELRPDAILFFPKEKQAYIVEFQAQRNPKILDKACLEAFLYEYQMSDKELSEYEVIGALVFFTTNKIIPKNSKYKGKYNQGENPPFRYICLEDFEYSKDYKWGSLILALCENDSSVIKEKMPELWNIVEKQKNEGKIDLKKYEYFKESMQLILISKPSIRSIASIHASTFF